jgi:hypothetical protein
MEDKYICCICQKEHTGWGNNPSGAVDQNKKLIKWNADDRCCDECNRKYVLPGRMYRFYRVIKPECLVKKEID